MQSQLASSISWNTLEPHLLDPRKIKRPISVLSSSNVKLKGHHNRSMKSSLLIGTTPKSGMRTTSIKTIGSGDFTSHLVSPPNLLKRGSSPPARIITFNK